MLTWALSSTMSFCHLLCCGQLKLGRDLPLLLARNSAVVLKPEVRVQPPPLLPASRPGRPRRRCGHARHAQRGLHAAHHCVHHPPGGQWEAGSAVLWLQYGAGGWAHWIID